jgi:uncharacterized protein YgiM (DUF1202 family)
VGWVIAAGIARSTPNAEIGTVKAPTQGKAATVNRARATVSASVSGLRVHSSPSLNAPVVTTVTRGQHMVVLSRVTGWVKVRLSDGTVGWISSSYVHGKKHVSHTSRVSQTVSGTRTNVAVNVRSGPSLHNSIVTVIPPGGTYQVLGWSNGWAHVRLPNGTVGWVSGTVLGSTGTTYNSYTYSRSKRTTSHRSTSHHAYSGARLTAGVRVHSRPGIKAPVVTLAASGTHITILGYRGSWALVRLPSGTTGYVLGMYVRA